MSEQELYTYSGVKQCASKEWHRVKRAYTRSKMICRGIVAVHVKSNKTAYILFR